MREYVTFKRVIEDLEAHDGQELLDTIEVKDGKQALGEVKFGLQEFWSVLVTLDMRFNCFRGMLENLFFKSVSQVENNIISVSFDCKCEEVNFELDSCVSEVLESKSEFSTHDEYFNCLSRYQELLVDIQKFDNVGVREYDISVTELVRSLVVDQN